MSRTLVIRIYGGKSPGEVPLYSISERHQAGESIDLLAKDHGRNAEEIEKSGTKAELLLRSGR